MNIVGISFSHAENSLQTRGLYLMQDILPINTVCDMTNYNIPVCSSNKSDGVVPQSVDNLISVMESADVLIFAISEATGHYCAGFKNVMDWLVVKAKFNARLGTDYAITDTPIFVVTFTPAKNENVGNRHFAMTVDLLEKLGAKVQKTSVIPDSWKTVIPGHSAAVKPVCRVISDFLKLYTPNSITTHKKDDTDSLHWLTNYNEWDMKWKSID
tara:strand:- start:96 stop:734 length:639 start_codon:yes stop_codon:yes gene_type:complete